MSQSAPTLLISYLLLFIVLSQTSPSTTLMATVSLSWGAWRVIYRNALYSTSIIIYTYVLYLRSNKVSRAFPIEQHSRLFLFRITPWRSRYCAHFCALRTLSVSPKCYHVDQRHPEQYL